jgi:hypothetical protein
MRTRLAASLIAGVLAIFANTLALLLADAISLPTAHGGLLRLISRWFAECLAGLGLGDVWRQVGGLPSTSPAFQTGFHIAVGIAMSVFYAFVVEPLDEDRPIAIALVLATIVWIANAAVVLPLTGEGFAGSAHLTFAGMAWFAAAHTLFFVASFNTLASGRALFIHRHRKPVLPELFPLNFGGIPGDLSTTTRTQAQFVAIRECGSNHC